MSSNAEGNSKTTLTSLPTELITRIVRLSSPKPSWDNAIERFKLLRNLALVCRALRGPAQEELFRHVVLRSAVASRAFVAVLKSRAGARFASTPRSLRVETEGKERINQDKFAIPFIAKRCLKLESMWLLNIDSLDIAVVTSGTDLKELYCAGCDLVATLHSRRLEALSLTRLGFRDCPRTHNLNPKNFPTVKSLDASTPLQQGAALVAFANSVAAQLSSLCIVFGWRGHGLVGLDPKLLSNLCILDTRLPEPDIPHFLPFLPSNIRHLRAQASPLSWHAPIKRSAPEVMDIYLEGSKYPCLKNLEHFRCGVDDSDPELSTEMAKELADKLEGLRPGVRLSFDGRDSPRGPESLDARFNPTFWTFVDDAEAEEARRAPEAREGI
ncbi:hypothetical protein RQP46_005224 [Phenoliferia psychrophenolica]